MIENLAERERLVEGLSLAITAEDLGTWEWDPCLENLKGM